MLYKDYLNNRRGYQEDGHILLLERKHACLFYKPGKGKTYPTIDAIRDIDGAKNNEAKVLILSTADAIKNMWEAEIVPQNILPKNTVLMTINSAIQDKTKSKLLSVKWDIIVVDECHKVKSYDAKISKLVHMLTKKCEYVFGLSGTPRGNSDLDIYCQFHNLNISEWGTITKTLFITSCCEIEIKYFNGNQVQIPTKINDKYRAGWERNIAMYTQRVGYDESDNMPSYSEEVIKIPYEPTKEYLQAEEGVISIPKYETTLTKLAAIIKLHQIANGYVYVTDDDFCRKTHKFNKNYKLSWLRDNLGSGTKTIVYRFEQDLQDIKDMLTISGRTYTEVVDDFKKGKARILLLQCSRCESFNLQMCDELIFYTLDYSYIKYNQMIHRLYRLGRDEAVKVKILLMSNTIEETIWKSVKNKESLADLFMRIKGGSNG